MAVAAYASVLSLLRVVDNIQHPSRLQLFSDTTQIDDLREKLRLLQHFLEVHPSTIVSKDIECMARKIPEVTNRAESLIDSYVFDQLSRESKDPQNDVERWNIESFPKDIRRVLTEFESINEALTKLRTSQHDQEQPRVSIPSPISSAEKKSVVGFDDQLEQVLNKLIGNQPDLEIVSIVGMGGIGKTTLGRSVFDHPYNSHRFHVRIWLTISQDYSLKRILQGLLEDGILGDKKDRESGDESERDLITKLHKKLFGQRYLIVLDDVWSAEAWHDLKQGFPNNRNASRVLVTSRLSDVARSLDSRNDHTYSMKFLDEDKSWDLFSEKAFAKGGRSRELEVIGREISKRCNGLPLLLVVIAGLLANSSMTAEYWQTVNENINLFAYSADDEYCSRTLSLSYNHLPIHLKPCFLYMRHFKEDSWIGASKLVESWVAQGFVRPMRGKTLEEAASKYLEDLIGRNMLLIIKRGKRGNIKFCGVHDLLRDLCIKESNKERLLDHIPRIFSVANDLNEACYLCKEPKTKDLFLLSEIFGAEFDRMSSCSSCNGTSSPELGGSRSVAVVKTNSENIAVATRYRRLSLRGRYRHSLVDLHAIRLLWNLESLQISTNSMFSKPFMPKEIWEMPQLRHLTSSEGFMLADPVSMTSDIVVLENLQTIKCIRNFKWPEKIVRRIPNLRKLGICYDNVYFSEDEEEEDWSRLNLQNLAHLKKLESLFIDSCTHMDFKKVIAFPCSLKKLTLLGCRIMAWDDLTVTIGSLPNLQVLKLLHESVLEEEWGPIEGGEFFPRLKYLELDYLDLAQWRVDNETTQFPALETLVLDYMEHLEAIPREIGELPSLKLIYLKSCRCESIVESAKDIVEEQLSYGNVRLVVRVKEDFNGTIYQIGGTDA